VEQELSRRLGSHRRHASRSELGLTSSDASTQVPSSPGRAAPASLRPAGEAFDLVLAPAFDPLSVIQPQTAPSRQSTPPQVDMTALRGRGYRNGLRDYRSRAVGLRASRASNGDFNRRLEVIAMRAALAISRLAPVSGPRAVAGPRGDRAPGV
jgi:hypothetical protein